MTGAALLEPPCPPCPYCHERQAYNEARPSKPHVTRAHATEWFTDCRACGQRIIWGYRFGNGSLEQLGTGKTRYFWSKP